MKKKILILAFIGMLLMTSFFYYISINNIINLDEVYGTYRIYGGDVGFSYLQIFKGKDDAHLDISAFGIEEFFYVRDVKITKNKNGKITAEKVTNADDDTFPREMEEYLAGHATHVGGVLKITIKRNRAKIDEKNPLMYWGYGYDEFKGQNIEYMESKFEYDEPESEERHLFPMDVDFVKDTRQCITEEEKDKALNDILDSDFTNVNKDIFEIVDDTENYFIVKVKSYIYNEGDNGKKQYLPEDISIWRLDDSNFSTGNKYYNIEKKTKKILKLSDIIKNSDELNEYIREVIEEKKSTWFEDNREFFEKHIIQFHEELDKKEADWEYGEFTGLGEIDNIEHFRIDENKKVVKISCLEHKKQRILENLIVTEKHKILGDLIIDVPFSFFELN